MIRVLPTLPPKDARAVTTVTQLVAPFAVLLIVLCSDRVLDACARRAAYRCAVVGMLLCLFARNLCLHSSLPLSGAEANIADFGVSNLAVAMSFRVIRLVGQGDPRRFQRLGSGPVQGSPPGMTVARVQWSVQLLLAMRGVGWNWGSEHAHTWPQHPPTHASKKAWLRDTLGRLVRLYFLMDVLHTINQHRSAFFSPSLSIYAHPSLLPHLWDTLLAGASGICGLQASYYLTMLVLVLTNMSQPNECIPLYGGLAHLRSIETFWSRFWHQLFRDSFVHLPAAWVGQSRAAKTMGAFVLSALLHALPNYAMLRRLPSGSVAFFLLQPVGVLLERAVLHPKEWTQPLGALWTLAWFSVVGALLLDEYIRAGFWYIPLVPVSIISALSRALFNVDLGPAHAHAAYTG